MKNLIIYSTKHGTAEKAAHILKTKLQGETHLVNIMKEAVPDLDEYESVIIGGSIYIGKIQQKLSNYVEGNLPTLLEKNIGLFICAGENDKDLRDEELEKSFPQSLFRHAVAKEVFGYEIEMEKLNFFEKFIMSKVKGVKTSIHSLSEDTIKIFAENMRTIDHL